MFESVLIANRGEIACRIIRTARRMGLRTIAVHSRADAGALHVRMADEAHEIGPAPAALSYLNAERILEVARRAGAQCLHPGYGFLSENAAFAEACAAAGIVFVGPPPQAIRAMGLKDEAKALVRAAGAPVTPGYDGADQDAGVLAREADKIGYPVLIKAVAGGGGKGMRRVDRREDFADALAGAQREAQSAFANPRVLIEKFIPGPRHIEMQVFCDAHGHAVHLFERDCSLQRRHQKVVEEAPAPGMTAELRAAMGVAAVAAAKAVGYVGAGTVEFIVDGAQGLRPDGFWFMEMNTRLQVEHPVTEAITGLDLVELQLRAASGQALPFGQGDLHIHGHAVEARIYAEDPQRGFLPSTGRLLALDLPDGAALRIDAGVEQGDEVTPHYDPMIAKMIAHGATRAEALARLEAGLAQSAMAGVRSNVGFLRRLVTLPEFVAGRFDTGLIDRHLHELAPGESGGNVAIAAGAAALMAERQRSALRGAAALRAVVGPSPWDVADAFQFDGVRRMVEKFEADGQSCEVAFEWRDGLTFAHYEDARESVRWQGDRWVSLRGDCDVYVDGAAAFVLQGGEQVEVRPRDPSQGGGDHGGDGDSEIRSPMHGKVVALLVQSGEKVHRGQRLAIVEAMKMEHVLIAPRAGVAREVCATAGQQVAQGAILMHVVDENEAA